MTTTCVLLVYLCFSHQASASRPQRYTSPPRSSPAIHCLLCFFYFSVQIVLRDFIVVVEPVHSFAVDLPPYLLQHRPSRIFKSITRTALP